MRLLPAGFLYRPPALPRCLFAKTDEKLARVVPLRAGGCFQAAGDAADRTHQGYATPRRHRRYPHPVGAGISLPQTRPSRGPGFRSTGIRCARRPARGQRKIIADAVQTRTPTTSPSDIYRLRFRAWRDLKGASEALRFGIFGSSSLMHISVLDRRSIFVLNALLDVLSDVATRILHNPDRLGIGIMC